MDMSKDLYPATSLTEIFLHFGYCAQFILHIAKDKILARAERIQNVLGLRGYEL